MIVSKKLPTEEARRLVRACFKDLIDQMEDSGGFVPSTDRPEWETAQQIILSQERIEQLQGQIAASIFDGTVIDLSRVAFANAANFEKLGSADQVTMLSGFARALIERERLYQLRAEDRLAPFVPKDPLFQTGLDLAPPTPLSMLEGAEAKGPCVSDAIARYLAYGKTHWVQKTHLARQWQLRFFEEHVGGELPLALVTAEHVRSFRDGVRSLHKSHGRRRGTFAKRQTDNAGHRISDKTAAIIFDPIKTFFRWAKSVEGLVNSNPAEDIRIAKDKKVKGQKVRRPFSAAELKTLFSAPLFSGCQSRDRRYLAGEKVIKDAKYWIPILGFYTGARLGELVQLHVRDIHLEGPIPFLSINEENGPDIAPANQKHVKSEAGVRVVPIHPDVMNLGFGAFVDAKACQKGKGRVRLFEEFSYGSDGQASTVASKWFARFMDSAGLPDTTLVYHSFRHNAEDALRNALIPQYVIDRIIGHSDGSVSSGYGEGASIEVMHDAICKMKLLHRCG